MIQDQDYTGSWGSTRIYMIKQYKIYKGSFIKQLHYGL